MSELMDRVMAMVRERQAVAGVSGEAVIGLAEYGRLFAGLDVDLDDVDDWAQETAVASHPLVLQRVREDKVRPSHAYQEAIAGAAILSFAAALIYRDERAKEGVPVVPDHPPPPEE